MVGLVSRWRIPGIGSVRAAPAGQLVQNRFPVCVQYSTKVFKDDKWAIHYYAPIQGHELVTRRDLTPSAERLVRTIKEEEVDLTEYQDFADPRFRSDTSLMTSTTRSHSLSTGYLTPAEFESAYWVTQLEHMSSP